MRNLVTPFTCIITLFIFLQARSQSSLPLIESAVPAKHNTMVIFFSGDGGWRGLDVAVTAYLNEKNIPVIGVNTKKYLWEEKKPAVIAGDIQILIKKYGSLWKASNVILMGYSMGAEILPHSVNDLEPAYADRVKDMILIAPAQNACYEVKLIFYAYDTNEGEPIIDQLKKLKIKNAYVICDDHKISLCNSGLDGVIDHTELTGGHHFDGDYDMLCGLIGKRLNL